MTMLHYETEAKKMGFSLVAGVDEAGRGPLAGPVVAAAVILPEGFDAPGLTDSKKLSAARRDQFYDLIMEKAVSAASHVIEADAIDSTNILRAALSAMAGAILKLSPPPGLILVDGNQRAAWPGPQKTIVKGDSLSLSIAAASVIAKVERDRIMEKHAAAFPGYGFERHKGYAVAEHLEAIERLGPCPIHRKTFKGVREHVPAGEASARPGAQIRLA